MREKDIEDLICVGDRVIDQMDGERRIISGFINASVMFEDGGVMDIAEISTEDIRLEGEPS